MPMSIVFVLVAALVNAGTARSAHFSTVLQRTLPAALITSLDVRWDSGDSVLLAAGRRGVFRYALGKQPATPQVVIPGEKAPSGFFFTSMLASDDRRIVAASPFAAIGWMSRSNPGVHEVPFAATSDVDLHDNQIAILGGNRDEHGVWEPDGAIVWIGTLSPSLRQLKPIMFSTPGPGPMAFCGFLGTGVIRYRADGALFVLPGVEPNAFLYSGTGHLLRTWQTRDLGYYDRCTLTKETFGLFARDMAARNRWLSQCATVDDVVVLPEGFGLLIRTVVEGRTRWEMIVLSDRDASKRILLPFSSPISTTHLRADARGRKIAFLMFETGDNPTAPPPRAPQIVVTEYQP